MKIQQALLSAIITSVSLYGGSVLADTSINEQAAGHGTASAGAATQAAQVSGAADTAASAGARASVDDGNTD
jgi:hypothetical protein